MYRSTQPTFERPATDRGHVPARPRRWSAALRVRARALRDEGESGAQVIEYAMLGVVAAVACGALIALLQGGLLDSLVQTVMNGAIEWVQLWFA